MYHFIAENVSLENWKSKVFLINTSRRSADYKNHKLNIFEIIIVIYFLDLKIIINLTKNKINKIYTTFLIKMRLTVKCCEIRLTFHKFLLSKSDEFLFNFSRVSFTNIKWFFKSVKINF